MFYDNYKNNILNCDDIVMYNNWDDICWDLSIIKSLKSIQYTSNSYEINEINTDIQWTNCENAICEMYYKA